MLLTQATSAASGEEEQNENVSGQSTTVEDEADF